MLALVFAAAFVVKGFSCDLFDVNLAWLPGSGHLTVTDFADGTVVLDCQGTVPNPYGVRIVYDQDAPGGLCGICIDGFVPDDGFCYGGFLLADQWTETIAADGKTHLRCRMVGQ